MYTEKEAKELLKRHRAGQCSLQDIALLQRWSLKLASEAAIDPAVVKYYARHKHLWKQLTDPGGNHKKMRWISQSGLAAAAGLVLVLSIGTLYYLLHDRQKNQNGAISKGEKPGPGGYNATLFLANGRKIDLNTAPNGQLASMEGVRIIKTTDGTIAFDVFDATRVKGGKMNTLTTPKGGEYQVVLSDGSRVHLNAESSFNYPTSFSGADRLVKLDGEAYFAVSKNNVKPFIVSTLNQNITVTGTHFNVSSYPGESVFTTLTEGSVKISSQKAGTFVDKQLEVGQQSVVNEQGITVANIDTLRAIAWKNGNFNFTKTPLENALRQIIRWYDVDIDLSKIPKGKVLDGEYNRKDSLTEIIDNISEMTGVKLTVEGRRILVQ